MPGCHTVQACSRQRMIKPFTCTVARELLRYGIPELLLLACISKAFEFDALTLRVCVSESLQCSRSTCLVHTSCGWSAEAWSKAC